MDGSRRDHSPPGQGFVLTGTFHSLNRGDSAMQLVVASHLRERWPEARVAIHAPHPDTDREIYGDFEVVQCSRRKPLRALGVIARAMLWRVTGKRTALPAELDSYRQAAVVVDLSGDSLTETFGWRCPVSHTVPFFLARLMGIPVCLLGQTIGPFGRLVPWFRWILRRAAFISARDEETFHYLKGWKLSCPVELTADLAFLLEPAASDDATANLRRAGPWDPSRPLVGVTPSNFHNIRGIESRHADDAREAIYQTLAEACRTLAAEAGAQIAIIPHVFGPGPPYDDRIAARRLAALLGEDIPVIAIADPLHPRQLKAIIGRCELFIGTRMHSVIAALSQAVPTLAFAYSPKALHLMNRVGMADFAVDITRSDIGDVVSRVRQAWLGRSGIQKHLKDILRDDLLPAAGRNLELLDRYILSLGG